MNQKVTLLRYSKASGVWQRLPLAKGKSGRPRPGYVSLAGRDVFCAQGHYEIRWYENRRTMYENVGHDLKDAMSAKEKKERLLLAKSAALRADTKLVEVDTRVRLSRRLDDFLAAAESRGSKEIASISKRVGRAFLTHSGCVFADEVKEKHLTAFLQSLRDAGLADRTCRNQWDRLKAFLKSSDVDVTALMPIAPRYEEKLPEVYTEEELDTFLSSVGDDDDRLVFEVLLQTGLREQEAMHLAWDDLDLGLIPSLVVRSKPDAKFWIKDKEERAVPLPQALVESLKLGRERHPASRWVLGTSSDKPNTHLLRLLKRLVRKAGLNCGSCDTCKLRQECGRWGLHKFRATYATLMFRNGADARTVQHLMGHSDMESTMRYLRPQDMPERQRMVNAVFRLRR